MECQSKSKDRRHLRERNALRQENTFEKQRLSTQDRANLQIQLNLIGSEIEFKKFEKLLGDSLQRVQILRKGGLTARDQSLSNQDRKEKGEYFLQTAKPKKQQKVTQTKSPKSSLLSVAETQLTDSDLYEGSKRPQASTNGNASYTVEYLINQNKHLKEQIEMILRSRGKHSQTQLIVRKISEYRRIISEQQAEISMLKKYHIAMMKQAEKAKAQLAAATTKVDSLKAQIDKFKLHSSPTKQLRTSQPLVSVNPQSADTNDVHLLVDRLRQCCKKNQVIQDLLSCLEKQIYWNRKQTKPNIPQSPRGPSRLK